VTDAAYDSLLILSFGGPEAMDDVMPFLENVLRGRNVPPERMLEVASHYEHFGGCSPINDHCRTLVAAVILGVSESLMATFFGPSWSLAVSFGLLLMVLAVRPAGLFGR